MTIDANVLPIRVRADAVVPGPGAVSSTRFEDVYERHLSDVFRYALIVTGDRDDADDVTAETFARALRAWRSGREPNGPVLPWLFVLARNIATDRWRKARRALGGRPASTSPSDVARVEAEMWLQSVVRILPARQRAVIGLRYHHELTDADIAAVMGLSESGVRSLVARAIATLRRHPEVWQ
jgi:RNA polymerase sigma factor (sigma-70 family)